MILLNRNSTGMFSAAQSTALAPRKEVSSLIPCLKTRNAGFLCPRYVFLQCKVFCDIPYSNQMQSTQAFRIAYCVRFFPEEADIHCHTCTKLLNSVLQSMPDLGKELKFHLVVHLIDNILAFGPSSSFSTERYIYMYMQYTFSFLFSIDLSPSFPSSEHRTYTAIIMLPVGT